MYVMIPLSSLKFKRTLKAQRQIYDTEVQIKFESFTMHNLWLFLIKVVRKIKDKTTELYK